jgi:predicted glycogen debranching enzyme
MMSSQWAPTPQWSREWLVSNGLGGFASGTVAGAVARRYHAFLCAAPNGPQERFVLVTKIEETLCIGEERFESGANFWAGPPSPRGDLLIESFSLDPFPRWVYRVQTQSGPVRIQKTVWMPDERNASIARYELLSGDAPQVSLQVRPFLAPRDYHSSQHENADFNATPQLSSGAVSFKPYAALPAIRFTFEGEFCPDGGWYLGFQWPIERERGLDSSEDAYSPGYFTLALQSETPAFFSASVGEESLSELSATLEPARERRAGLIERGKWLDTENRLKLAADQFLVKRTDGLFTVLAGYPWFTDWGRDTMIALPGLCLNTGRFEVAASILRAFAGAMDKGMIPNRFPEKNETPDTNTVDATLWMFHAVAAYVRASGDFDTLKSLYPKLVESIEWHLAGTRYGIKADDDDGLLCAGDPHTQLTWMDAKIGETAFTPRWGKPVEIQALWFNALVETAGFARHFDDKNTAGICTEWARKVAGSFADLFWNAEEGCLFDCINSQGRDGALRPNQIFAVSLPHRLLNSAQEASVVAAVAADLLTPHGLRSLSPRDSRYRGLYEGDQWARDSAYHQGTVWAWPTGAFLEAYLKVNSSGSQAKSQVRAWLSPLIAHLDEAGLGTISEIFDGDSPNEPRGCFAQAWSVSEVLRLWQLSA